MVFASGVRRGREGGSGDGKGGREARSVGGHKVLDPMFAGSGTNTFRVCVFPSLPPDNWFFVSSGEGGGEKGRGLLVRGIVAAVPGHGPPKLRVWASLASPCARAPAALLVVGSRFPLAAPKGFSPLAAPRRGLSQAVPGEPPPCHTPRALSRTQNRSPVTPLLHPRAEG